MNQDETYIKQLIKMLGAGAKFTTLADTRIILSMLASPTDAEIRRLSSALSDATKKRLVRVGAALKGLEDK